MKNIILMSLIYFAAIASCLAQSGKRGDVKIMCESSLSVSAMCSSELDMGCYIIGDFRKIENCHADFHIDGDSKRDVNWNFEISSLNKVAVNYSYWKMINKMNGSWTDIGLIPWGKLTLDQNGDGEIKVSANQIKIDPGAPLGQSQISVTLTVEYSCY